MCLIFNSIRDLDQYDHLAKWLRSSLIPRHTLSCLVPTLCSGCSLYFFFLLSFNTIESYSVPGLGLSRRENTVLSSRNSSLSGETGKWTGKYNRCGAGGCEEREESPSSVLETRQGCLEEGFWHWVPKVWIGGESGKGKMCLKAKGKKWKDRNDI